MKAVYQVALAFVVALPLAIGCKSEQPPNRVVSMDPRPETSIANWKWGEAPFTDEAVAGVDYGTVTYVTRKTDNEYEIYFAIWSDHMQGNLSAVAGGPERENSHWIVHYAGEITTPGKPVELKFDCFGMERGGEMTLNDQTADFQSGTIFLVSSAGNELRSMQVSRKGLRTKSPQAVETTLAKLRTDQEIVAFFTNAQQ